MTSVVFQHIRGLELFVCENCFSLIEAMSEDERVKIRDTIKKDTKKAEEILRNAVFSKFSN